MPFSESQYFALVALLVTIGIPIGSAVNGPIVPVEPSEFPYLVMVKDADYGPTAGVFLSKRFVLLEPYVAAEPNPLVYSGGQQYTAMSKWSTSTTAFSVLKLCTSPAFNGPFYNFAASAHSTFSSNETGKVLFYGQDGTLYGHTADIVTNPICVIQHQTNGGPHAYVIASTVCIALQQSNCTAMNYGAFESYPVLAINGIVEAMFYRLFCSREVTGTVYKLPSIYRKIMSFKTEILASPGIVVANP